MPSEFDLIRRFFDRPPRHADLAVGDDAALVRVSPDMQLVVSTDMLVAGTHFLPSADATALGWKTLAVNVSDLAAMGARPRWATLALSLPAPDTEWLAAFARGFLECCDAFAIDLVGGDTTRGPLNLCPTIFGEVPVGSAVTRAGARAGDDLWVTGQPGRAVLALARRLGNAPRVEHLPAEFSLALDRPQPRLSTGLALRGIASAMLDVSDGLLGDLGHILDRSGVGAELERDLLPIGALRATGLTEAEAVHALLYGGDDYELLFTAPPDRREQIALCSTSTGVPIHRIGQMTASAGQLAMAEHSGVSRKLARRGYDHFRAAPPEDPQ